jgi:rod shape-determining protein MreC
MKFNRIQKILIGIVCTLLVFTILFNTSRSRNEKSYIQSSSYSAFSMIRYTLVDAPVESVENFIYYWSNYYQIYQENIMLRNQIDNLASAQAKLNEAQRQINQLKKLNDLKEINSDYSLINATVLNRSIDSWNNIITINMGDNDGVKNNYAVMSPKGLIGKVVSVNENSAVVELMTTSNKTNKVSVKIEHEDYSTSDAILEFYDYEQEAYKLILLDTNVTIKEGSRVITSGMGGVFPSGILVGEVLSANKIENEVSMNIYVTPSADFSDLNYVQVVQRGDGNNED